jgi:hypothetical protein
VGDIVRRAIEDGLEVMSDRPRHPDTTFRAKHSGTCSECGGRIEPGQMIVGRYYRSRKTEYLHGPYRHAMCPEKPEPPKTAE